MIDERYLTSVLDTFERIQGYSKVLLESQVRRYLFAVPTILLVAHKKFYS